MLNLITNEQMRLADQFTIQHQPIDSVDLMEQAAKAFVEEFCIEITPNRNIIIVAGKGNNGGDGLAIARLLYRKGFQNLTVYILNVFSTESENFKINKFRLKEARIKSQIIHSINDFPPQLDVVIDAVLGTGFKKGLRPELVDIFSYINTNSNQIISVDCPSGLNTDDHKIENYQGIKAHHTISFQRPKLIFTLPESQVATETFSFVEIGLMEEYIQKFDSDYYWIELKDIVAKLQPRPSFSHKGTYGHLLVISGSSETLGATILSSKAALYSGAGLVTIALEPENYNIINGTQPEVMTTNIHNLKYLDFDKFNSIAIGPGLGQDEIALKKLDFILSLQKPLILDADALNLIAKNEWQNRIPKQSIMTPHVKEFDRLFGEHTHWISRLETAKTKATELESIILLKNQYSYIIAPNGKVYINPTGNPVMAQGGMGDVLTGCIASFLTQGLTPLDAAIVGCYMHGLAGDELSETNQITPPTSLIQQIPQTLKHIYIHKKGSR